MGTLGFAAELGIGWAMVHPAPIAVATGCTAAFAVLAWGVARFVPDDAPAAPPRMHEAPTLEMARVHALPVWEPLNVPGPAPTQAPTHCRAGDQLATLLDEMAGEES